MSVAQIAMFACTAATIVLTICTARINRQTHRIIAHTRRINDDIELGIIHHCPDCKRTGGKR